GGQAPRGTILLGFHLGPANTDVALRILGHPLAWVGCIRKSRAWASREWAPFLAPGENLSPPDEDTQWFWVGYLYRARRILLEGPNDLQDGGLVGRRRAVPHPAARQRDDDQVGMAHALAPDRRACRPRDHASGRTGASHHRASAAAGRWRRHVRAPERVSVH